MSNNNYKNYNSYSSAKPAKTEAEKSIEVKTEVTEPVVEETAEVKEESVPVVEEAVETVEVKTEPVKPIIGVVTGCAKLNVRKEPSKDADIVSVIEEGSTVEINNNKSTKDFYSVCAAAGFEGYCMKKFIVVQ